MVYRRIEKRWIERERGSRNIRRKERRWMGIV